MKFSEFKALPLEEKLLRLNKHLLNLKGVPGKLELKFQNDEFDFSYSSIKKYPKEAGVKIDGKAYVAYPFDEIPSVVKPQQDVVKSEKVVKQKQSFVKEQNVELTKDEILFVKELFKNKQDIVKTKQALFLPQFTGAKKTTGISVYVELWDRWNEFKKVYPMYSGTDLLALALEEFMEKYEEKI